MQNHVNHVSDLYSAKVSEENQGTMDFYQQYCCVTKISALYISILRKNTNDGTSSSATKHLTMKFESALIVIVQM